MKETKFIAWPDTHLPEHDPKAVGTALQILKWYRPEVIVVLGDFLDCAPVSHWLKQNSRNRTKEDLRLSKDYAMGNELLDAMTSHGCKHLVYLNGNHEDWVNDAIEKNPEFEGLIEIEVGLKFEERKKKHQLTYLEYGKHWKLGKLGFTHGLYTCKNHAAMHVQQFGCSLIYGHLHDVQTATKVSPIDVEDKHIATSVGCLCKKNPAFMENRPNNWIHCITTGLVRPDGNFNFDPIIISNGVASYAGRTFKA